MTNTPEGTTPDSSPGSAGTDVPPVVAAPAPVTAEANAEATFGALVEPRSANRLVLEAGVWHQISPKYVTVQFISSGFILAIVVTATLVLALAMHQWWAWIPGGILTAILVATLAVLPRQARSIGYQLREDDLVFRRGILWQRFVAVPYGRMQLVDITHGPLDRMFAIAQLKFVTAAASTGVEIPGLPQQTAETLRDHLIAVAESRRTGL
ncbi:PH domain-containing protein [Microbacterium sp. C7(2022)]|uniref:PH domain-containing protein n=1 Tax=Microbacterium sp. C7(2022) TaxID=2992759 RepID=UPI00237B4F91|nr:PH domain-containing protein [Microbacterium sp. C7(2022)]MDE0545182.1 PH domain-containing protein [Microbacterium sp. C7(2022)]